MEDDDDDRDEEDNSDYSGQPSYPGTPETDWSKWSLKDTIQRLSDQPSDEDQIWAELDVWEDKRAVSAVKKFAKAKLAASFLENGSQPSGA